MLTNTSLWSGSSMRGALHWYWSSARVLGDRDIHIDGTFDLPNSLNSIINFCKCDPQGFGRRRSLSRAGINLICREGRAGQEGAQP